MLVLLVALFLLLQLKFWGGDGGLLDVFELKRKIAEQEAENNRLKERNLALEAEVMDLKGGVAAIEERARSDLGMIKEGESFFQAIEE